MMQKILVAVAAGVAMVNGGAHIAKCYDEAACDLVKGTACGTKCATEAAANATTAVEVTAACVEEGLAIAKKCGVVVPTEEGSGEAGAAGADATLPSVLAFTVGAAVAGMM